jgi:hypothetical protein
MAQFGRPISDVTFTSWTGVGVNTAGNRYQNIDESTASNTDYNYGANNSSSAVSEHLLTTLANPGVTSGHVVRFRYAKVSSGTLSGTGGTVNLTVALYQGATLIASTTVACGGTWTDGSFTLTGVQAGNISDYSNLRFRFTQTASGGGGNARGSAVSFAELEIPDAGVNVAVSEESVVVNEVAPTVVGNSIYAPTVESIVINELAPSVGVAVDVVADVESVVVNEITPSIATGAAAEATDESITISEQAPSILTSSTAAVATEGITVDELTPSVVIGTSVEVTAESITINDIAPSVLGGATAQITDEAVAVTELAPTVAVGATFAADTERVDINELSPTISTEAGTTVSPDPEVITISELTPTIAAEADIQPEVITITELAPSVVVGVVYAVPAPELIIVTLLKSFRNIIRLRSFGVHRLSDNVFTGTHIINDNIAQGEASVSDNEFIGKHSIDNQFTGTHIIWNNLINGIHQTDAYEEDPDIILYIHAEDLEILRSETLDGILQE